MQPVQVCDLLRVFPHCRFAQEQASGALAETVAFTQIEVTMPVTEGPDRPTAAHAAGVGQPGAKCDLNMACIQEPKDQQCCLE